MNPDSGFTTLLDSYSPRQSIPLLFHARLLPNNASNPLQTRIFPPLAHIHQLNQSNQFEPLNGFKTCMHQFTPRWCMLTSGSTTCVYRNPLMWISVKASRRMTKACRVPAKSCSLNRCVHEAARAHLALRNGKLCCVPFLTCPTKGIARDY
jgi:hypothetical protein